MPILAASFGRAIDELVESVSHLRTAVEDSPKDSQEVRYEIAAVRALWADLILNIDHAIIQEGHEEHDDADRAVAALLRQTRTELSALFTKCFSPRRIPETATLDEILFQLQFLPIEPMNIPRETRIPAHPQQIRRGPLGE